MAITKFPNGISSFGGVVGPLGYAGWWGTGVWFVDDDTGSDGNKGNDPEEAFKTIQKAIDSAGPHDTIFLKPRELGGLAYPGFSAHGYYTGSNIIADDQQGLAIIGTGRGGRGIGMSVQCMLEPDDATTHSTIVVKSPGVSIENLGLKCVLGASGAIYARMSTGQAYGLTVSNCFFKDFKTTAVSATGTINLLSIHWATIQHCLFKEAGCAIYFSSIDASVETSTIRDCDFVGVASTWSEDIRVGDCRNLTITDCRHAHDKPTGGATTNVYVNMVGPTGTGMISNCTYAEESTTVTDFWSLQGEVLNSNCYGSKGIIET